MRFIRPAFFLFLLVLSGSFAVEAHVCSDKNEAPLVESFPDGSMAVVSGSKIFRYDPRLNFLNETEIPDKILRPDAGKPDSQAEFISATASEDGALILVVGETILHYDKRLNLVRTMKLGE